MDSANSIFYFITDKMIEVQSFFLNVTNTIARIILLIAILTAALNFALTGTGLKENIIKIGKAFVFFSIVVFFYPRIISWITEITFSMAEQSIYLSGLRENIQKNINDIKDTAVEKRVSNNHWTESAYILTERTYTESNKRNIFENLIAIREFELNGKKYSYSTIAPAAALDSVFLIASDILDYSKKFDLKHPLAFIGSALCGFFAIVVGCFCIIEYLIAFVEFMFISSVGIILFPFSLWDGTKFVAESFIKSMLGFFMKLLFSAICIFFMLYVFTTIAYGYTQAPFTGQIAQIIPLCLCTLLIFYICKNAPALAQSLMSGSPSLTGAGAIGMVASTVMAISRLSHMQGAGAGAGMGVGGLPSTQATAAISGGTGGAIVNKTPPAFSLQAPAGMISLPAQQQRMAIEDHTGDLTRSISYTNRPLIEGGSNLPAVIPSSPTRYLPGGGQQALSFGGYGGSGGGGEKNKPNHCCPV